jgi:hypothetical protein
VRHRLETIGGYRLAAALTPSVGSLLHPGESGENLGAGAFAAMLYQGRDVVGVGLFLETGLVLSKRLAEGGVQPLFRLGRKKALLLPGRRLRDCHRKPPGTWVIVEFNTIRYQIASEV